MNSEYQTMAALAPGEHKIIAVIVDQEESFSAMLSTGYLTAESQDAYLLLLLVADASPAWMEIPEEYDKSRIIVEFLPNKSPEKNIIKLIRRFRPLLLGLPMDTEDMEGRYLAGKEFDIILQQAPCPVYLVKSPPSWTLSPSLSAFVPFWNDRNTTFAIDTALEISPRLKITAGVVVPPSADLDDLSMQKDELESQTGKWLDSDRFKIKILRGYDENQTLLKEIEHYDFLLIGASRGNRIARTLFGESRNKLATDANGPAIILREYQGKSGATLTSAWSYIDRFLPTLAREDRIEAYRVIRRGGRPTQDFFTMTALSSAIASLGLILDSAAVIIGAMLVAPLMSAIIGMGLAIIHGDMRFLFKTTSAVCKGLIIAILTGFVFGLVNFHGEPTDQILQRTSPSILDLLVALISGIAAAYALCRKNVSNSLPGVAIAVALVPPLATVGVCLSIGYWNLALGAFKLFFTNLVAIVFASALVFASFGFRPNIDTTQDQRKLKVFQRSFLATGILVTLMVVLLVTRTTEEVREASLEEDISYELSRYLDELKIPADLDQWSMTAVSAGTTQFDLQLKAPRELVSAEVDSLRQRLVEALDTPVVLNIELIPVTHLKSQ